LSSIQLTALVGR